MDDFRQWILGIVTGASLAGIAALIMLGSGRGDCEKELPKTQKCTLQWVKPEVSK